MIGQVRDDLESASFSCPQALIARSSRTVGLIVFFPASASRLSTRTFGRPATDSSRQPGHCPIDVDGHHRGHRGRHERRQRPRARSDLEDHVAALTSAVLTIRFMNIQVDQEILPQPPLGRNPVLGEQASQIRLCLTNRWPLSCYQFSHMLGQHVDFDVDAVAQRGCSQGRHRPLCGE